jgi:hypothetical protein
MEHVDVYIVTSAVYGDIPAVANYKVLYIISMIYIKHPLY